MMLKFVGLAVLTSSPAKVNAACKVVGASGSSFMEALALADGVELNDDALGYALVADQEAADLLFVTDKCTSV